MGAIAKDLINAVGILDKLIYDDTTIILRKRLVLMNEKRSFRIHKKSTTISIEPPFWRTLEKVAKSQNINLSTLITQINGDFMKQDENNFSSYLRVFCLSHSSGLGEA